MNNKLFAVSIVVQFTKADGKNIWTNDFALINCANESEAIGAGYIQTRDRYEYFKILEINALEISKEDLDRINELKK